MKYLTKTVLSRPRYLINISLDYPVNLCIYEQLWINSNFLQFCRLQLEIEVELIKDFQWIINTAPPQGPPVVIVHQP